MKLSKYIYPLLLITVMTCAAVSSFALEDAIIAVVNDELITLKDLKDYIRSTKMSLLAEGKSDQEIQKFTMEMEKDGINKLIEDKLILSKAKELGLEVNEKAIDQKMDVIIRKYPSEQDFLRALIDHGASITDLKNKITDQLKIEYIIEHEINSKIFINPLEVTDFYNANIDNFKKPERINLESIFIPFAGNKELAFSKAQEALDELSGGKPFSEVAEKYSKSPSIGVVEKGQFIKEIEDKIFALKLEDVSSIVEVEMGLFIFKLKGRIAPQIETIEDVKESIYDMLYHKKFRSMYKEWIDKLKKNAYIEIKE